MNDYFGTGMRPCLDHLIVNHRIDWEGLLSLRNGEGVGGYWTILATTAAPAAEFEGPAHKNWAGAANDVAGFVWTHDSRWMLTPTPIRRSLPEAGIGFFRLIPFPPHDTFRLLRWDRELLRGLLGADLISFHVRSDATNFFDRVERSLGARVNRTDGLIEFGGRTIRVGTLPIGIDFDLFESQSLVAPERPETRPERVGLGQREIAAAA